MRRQHSRGMRRVEPTNWFRQAVDSSADAINEPFGGDIFDLITLGVVGDGEDFECTVLRIKVETIVQLTATTVTNGNYGGAGMTGIALIGIDSLLPDPNMAGATDPQTDWLALRSWAIPTAIINPFEQQLIFTSSYDVHLDVKAKRKVAIGQHLVLVHSLRLVSVNQTVDAFSVVSILWQRTVPRR